MKVIILLLILFLSKSNFSQKNYDSLAGELMINRGLSKLVTKDIDTVKLIESLLNNFGQDNCLNHTWSGFTDYKDTHERMVSSSSNSVSEYGLTINRISAMYLISSLYFSDTLFTKSISLQSNKKGSMKYIDGVEVLFHKNRPLNSTVLYIRSCNRYGNYKIKLQDVKLINKAVDYYRSWFKLLKQHGINYLRDNNIFPLKNSEIFWESKRE